jgi:hypothetical protein
MQEREMGGTTKRINMPLIRRRQQWGKLFSFHLANAYNYNSVTYAIRGAY